MEVFLSSLKKIIEDLKSNNFILGLKKADLYNLGLNSTFFFDKNDTIPDNEEWSCYIDKNYENIEIKNKTFNLGKLELEFQNIEYDENKKIKGLFTEGWNDFIKELKYQSYYLSYKENNSPKDQVVSFGKIENCPLGLTLDEVSNLLKIGYVDTGKIDSIFSIDSFKAENVIIGTKEVGNKSKKFITEKYDFILIENFKYRLSKILKSEVEVVEESLLLDLFIEFKLDVKYIFDCKYLDVALFHINYRRDYSPINLNGSIKYIIRKIDLNKIYPLKGRDLRKVGITHSAIKASQRYILTVEDNYFTIENEEGHIKVYEDLKYSYNEINEREVLVSKINKFLAENKKQVKNPKKY